jgi:hypothetical protein
MNRARHRLSRVLFAMRVRRYCTCADQPSRVHGHGVAEPSDEDAQAQQNPQKDLQDTHRSFTGQTTFRFATRD